LARVSRQRGSGQARTQLAESLTGAAAGGHELAAADLDRLRDYFLLAREYRFAGHVLEGFHRYRPGGQ
jgi:hypothetical protein